MNNVTIQKNILNKLIDKYEKSKQFFDETAARRKIALRPSQIFSAYEDDFQYELCASIDNAVEEIAEKGFVFITKKGTKINAIELNQNNVDAVYIFLKRKPKKEINEVIKNLLEKYKNTNDVLYKFCTKQQANLAQNKVVEYCDNPREFEMVLTAVAEALKNEKTIFIRDFSIKIFGDSKAFEKIKSKVIKLLFYYGDFMDESMVLQALHIVNNPGYVYCKGPCVLSVKGVKCNIGVFEGGLGLSALDLKNVEKVDIKCSCVVTIENLTTYNTYNNSDAFVIYTGGFCDESILNFLKILYKNNSNKRYYHWGDIDVGGFLIFNHIKNDTGINFNPLFMNIEYLEKYKDYCKPLTENDQKRLSSLDIKEFVDTTAYMLKHNCKLEQEAFSVF